MIIEKDKTYITAGGYVVKLSYNLTAPPNMSPGQNDDYAPAGVSGWHWEKDGRILGLTPEWMEKLKIVSKCPFELPALPDGYKWADGFPQVRIPKRGEYFLSYDSRTKKFGEIKCCDRDYVTPYGTDGRRLILVPESQKETWPKYFVGECWGASDAYVQFDSPTSYFWVNKDGKVSSVYTEDRPFTKERLGVLRWKEVTKEEALKRLTNRSVPKVVKYYKHHNKFGDGIVFIKRIDAIYHCVRNNSVGMDQVWNLHCDMIVKGGVWVEISEGDALKLLNVNSVTSVPDVLSSKKEEGNTVKKETAINVATGVAKFVGKWGWRTVNYWAFEPATEVITKVMRAVRYVTLTGAIVGGVYAYNNPDKATDLIKSCLPKITVEAPEIMRG